MIFYPSLDEFKSKAQYGNMIPVFTEFTADMETPLSAFKRLDNSDYAFLLESVEGGEKWGRYSFLGNNPYMVFESRGKNITLHSPRKSKEFITEKDPLETLKNIMNEFKPVPEEKLPRFVGGAVGYIGYDMIRFFERLPDLSKDDLSLPGCIFLLTDTLVVFDNLRHRIIIISNARLKNKNNKEIENSYKSSCAKIERIKKQLSKPIKNHSSLVPILKDDSSFTSEDSFASSLKETDFCEKVRVAKEYITAGDIFQVVLARRLSTAISVPPFEIYRALRVINPSPYLFYLKLKDISIVGSSPEVLVRCENGIIEERPIAGTRPRGKDEREDRTNEEELLADPKERAEHVMLVDLGRNDVGRVSQAGSVEVSEFMVIERYSHVMHIVSNIKGILKDNMDSFDVMRACFPAGTVSGAPKIRAMEIIEELEPIKRGPYAGAVGYFSYSGSLDSCITIRTIVTEKDRAFIYVGAGIVADSHPESEFVETSNKAKGLIKAIKIAEANKLCC